MDDNVDLVRGEAGILNVAGVRGFSSDRAVRNHAEQIWKADASVLEPSEPPQQMATDAAD